MNKVDVNCLLGHWPFRKIYKNSFDDLRKVHDDNGISYGYVSSLNSIFYNDPFQGDEELHETLKGSDYKHILTINPTLPYFMDDIKRGIELFDIKGVRIYPTYHNYTLDNKNLKKLCNALKEFNLPLFLTVRMEDERMNYLLQPPILSMNDVSNFLKTNEDNSILLLNIRYGEILNLKDIINARNNIFFDTSGLKDLLFVVEKLLESFSADKIIYGSLHPLYCLKSSLLLVEKAEIDESAKNRILSANIHTLFGY